MYLCTPVVVGSEDSGNSWDFRMTDFLNDCDKDARVYANHLDPDSVLVFSEHCRFRTVATTDGFSTVTTQFITACKLKF